MRAEIITIGDELCRGEIVDTNASWLAGALWDCQITVTHIVSCQDLIEDIIEVTENAAQRSQLVLVSGGLGPTLDDLTVDAMCKLAGVEAVVVPAAAEKMQKRFAAAGVNELPDNAIRQVRVPKGARVFANSAGLAPGFELSVGSAQVVCLPGPPRELKAIFNEYVQPRVRDLRQEGGQVEHLAHCKFRIFGKGESHIAAALEGLELAKDSSLHYQVSFPETLVKLVVRDHDKERAELQLGLLSTEVRKRLGSWIYGENEDDLASSVGRLLLQRKQTIATAESCTGGMIAALLTAVPGSSAYVLGGAVTYSNAEKMRQLGVKEESLEMHGAVSEVVVQQMARGMCKVSGADWAVSVSGIAGPGGGTEDKPVGTVWLGVAGPDSFLQAKRYQWPGSRDQVRLLAAHWALNLVRRQLL